MPYATQSDCTDLYGTDAVVLATDRDITDTINVTVLSTALQAGTDTIDGYVSGIPGFPFADPPRIFKRMNVDFALYLAAQISAKSFTEQQQKTYDQHISYLEKVAQQKIRLTIDTSGDGETDTRLEPSPSANITSNVRLYTRAKMDSLL